MLNEGLASSASLSMSPAGTGTAAGTNNESVDCTCIPRLTGQLFYARYSLGSLFRDFINGARFVKTISTVPTSISPRSPKLT